MNDDVSSATLTETGGFAFVPSSVNYAEPASVPTIGGTKVLLWGGGFWKSSGCVVRFTPLDEGTLALETRPRSSIGKYVTPKGARIGAGKTGILCRMPRFTTTRFVFAEVAMNGKDFTTSRVCIRLYDNPTLALQLSRSVVVPLMLMTLLSLASPFLKQTKSRCDSKNWEVSIVNGLFRRN